MKDKKPNVLYTVLPSGSHLIRFDNIEDIFWYDAISNNPLGLGFRNPRRPENYIKERNILTSKKQKIIDIAKKELSIDKEFLDLVYKAKSEKREFKLNRFGGNLSMPHYASNSEKIFKRSKPGAKKSTLDLAFQVGTFVNGNYTESFIKILKVIIMCQQMGIKCNIDMFDSDTQAIGNKDSYVICNVVKSYEKLNFKRILVASHREFFNFTLFNGYSASGIQKVIGTFLGERKIIKDLSTKYDVIGGNTLLDPSRVENPELVSRILKIGLK